MLTFNAVDVETANTDFCICQVGIVHIRDGDIEDEWKTLINPESQFNRRNINIHGIDKDRVRNEPSFPQVYGEICRRLQGSVAVSHGAIDRHAFDLASEKYGLEKIRATWLHSTIVARRAWPSLYGKSGYNLANIAKDLNISFRHHDALEDAKVAAKIVIAACKEKNLDIQGWLQEIGKPRASSSSRYRSSAKNLRREGNPGGPLYGETVVFTGRLTRGSCEITKSEAADLAAKAGCNVRPDLTQEVTMLVKGVLKKESQKLRTAEDRGLRILQANLQGNDFFDLIDSLS